MLKLNTRLFVISLQTKIKFIPVRNVQVSVIGAAGEVGANVSLLLRHNHKIKTLHLYDVEEKVIGAAIELSHLPGGPEIKGFTGDNLNAAIRLSELILMVERVSRKPGNTREQMIVANAPGVQRLCRAMYEEGSEAFLAIATNPINSLVPFASTMLYNYGIYNPYKVFGVTQIDAARARAYAARALEVSCRNLYVPVIGGHSDETVIPLFSYITPAEYVVDPCQADSLTNLVRKSGTEIIFQKQGSESAVLGVAWSINEFCNILIDAISGSEVEATCYTANPYFGTRFFAGPTTIGPYGIIRQCKKMKFSDLESFLVESSAPYINRDVSLGENYFDSLNLIYKS